MSIPENCVEKIVKQDFLAPEIQRLLLSYLIGKLPIVNSRNRTIVHGDVHTGNILITEDEDVVFIDLDHVRFGDPYMDLVYASNLIGSRTDRNTYYAFLKDYFETGIPRDFWPVVNFYSICKAIVIMKAEREPGANGKRMLSIERLIQQHGGFKEEEPRWYRERQGKETSTAEEF